MRIVLGTSPHLNHAAFQEGVVPLASARQHLAQTFAPMGLLSLAAAVQDVASVSITDINKAINQRLLSMSSRFYADAADWILAEEPDLVGFMTEADSYHHVLRICGAIKAQRPHVRTLLGGPHASAVQQETLQAFPAVDFVIRGEGELALYALVGALGSGDLSGAGNLSYRRGGDVIANPDIPLIVELDTLPWPDFSLIELEDEDAIYLEIGRGCPFRCNFCFTAPYWKRRHRIKSPTRIMRELAGLKATYGRTDFNFTHDLFTTDRRWVIDFCSKLAASDLDLTWTCSSRTDTLDEEQIYWLREAGCRNIYFGVETGTAEMQKAIAKDLDLGEAREIIGKTAASGMGVTVGFIAGLPGESTETLRGTLHEAMGFLRLQDSTVHLFGYSPYRGSVNYERIRADLVFDPHFVDFPLGEDTHQENCSLMAERLNLFSRYSWPNTYRDLDLGVVRTAEEFFPIVNALRPVFIMLAEREFDPLHLLTAWAAWIGERNRERQLIGGRYRGTISEFLDFLGGYVEGKAFCDELLLERIRWERLKDALRTQQDQFLTEDICTSREILSANATILLGEFHYAPDFRPTTRAPEPFSYAFYINHSGAPGIAKVPPIALLALQLARNGTSRAILRAAISGDTGPSARSPAAWVDKLISDLERLDLLLPKGASGSSAFASQALDGG